MITHAQSEITISTKTGRVLKRETFCGTGIGLLFVGAHHHEEDIAAEAVQNIQMDCRFQENNRH